MTSTTMADEQASDETMSIVLSRLAGLHGQAVPVHRFAMLEHNRDGAPLAALPILEQAQEMWRARFPTGKIENVKAPDLAPGQFPALWVDDVGQRCLLLRGRLVNGTLAAEDAKGSSIQLEADVAIDGRVLVLSVGENAIGGGDAATGASATKHFKTALLRNKRVFAEAIFATMVTNILGLFAAFYTMQVYDRVVPTQGFSTLWVLTSGVLIAILFEFVLRQVRAHIVERANRSIEIDLSEILFGKALDIRLDARPATVGTFAAQIRQFDAVRNFLASSVLFVLADAPFALFFIAIIALIGGYVALVPMVMVPIALIATLVLRKKIEQYTEENITESNIKNGLLIEAIDGVESVKASGGEWKMRDRYRDLTAVIADSQLKLKLIGARASNISTMVQQANHVGLIAVGAYAIISGELTLGGLIACAILMGRIFTPLSQVPNLVVQWKHASIALRSLDRIMAMPGERDEEDRLAVPESCDGDIRLENVSFGYNQESAALCDAGLEIKASERIAVLGAVGSGKSTLIKILSGLYQPADGKYYLDGVDVRHIAPEFVREQIGYLPQDVRLFNGTLRENLTLGLPTPSDSRIFDAARKTGLDQSIQAHPKGLELPITEGGRGLSGGQRQLVGLTRLLLARPKILLLDEPTASMDGQLESQVMKHLFDQMPDDSVVVMITHKPSLLQHAQRVIVLDQGRIVLDGPRDEIAERLRKAQVIPSRRTNTAKSSNTQTKAEIS